MEKITKKILKSTGSTDYYVNLQLTEDFKLFGSYSELENNNSNNPNNQQIFITGLTESKVEEVQTYDTSNPYKVGYNGVTYVDRNPQTLVYNKITYIIDDVTYTTDFNTNITSYIYTGTTGMNNFSNNFLVKEDNVLINVDEKPRINNLINVDRQQLSVLDKILTINKVKTIEDIDDLFDVNF